MENINYWDAHAHFDPGKPTDNRIFSLLNLKEALNFPFTVGLHPWYIKDEKCNLHNWKDLVSHQNCVGIGECGLDKNVEAPLEYQISIFVDHIKISEKLKKPLIIHVVKAHQEIINLHNKYRPQQKWIIHGFNKNQQLAEAYVNNGIALSLNPNILKKSITENQNLLEVIPDHLLFLESDDKLVNMKEFYQTIAQIKGISIVNLQKQIQNNIHQTFKI